MEPQTLFQCGHGQVVLVVGCGWAFLVVVLASACVLQAVRGLHGVQFLCDH